jgi:dihydrofolate reductase
MIIIIAAVSENNALGKDNDLVWHLPDDFKRFKQLTSGHYIVMGRKTFESFPKPLPNRTHVIVTRQKYYAPEGCIVANSLQEAIQLCPKNVDTYIIGGGEIYKQSMAFAAVLEITRVHNIFEADTFFPEIDSTIWKLAYEEFHPKDEKHNFSFTYQTYQRK